ncbi:P450-derived glycosyltransferase activator [Streptomyces sp. NPDC056503]|uniref:cytochrome P450 family protein n=1 Tax=Streptomyces sp. NPDC056503 TaxID=3345842 RepID=UPI00367E9984
MTKHQIDPRLFDDSDLSRHLLAARGTQWMRGNRGDPYALILRDQGIEPRVLDVLYEGMRGLPPLRQSESDVWVTAGHEAGLAVLRDERLAPGEVVRAGGRARRRKVFGIDSGASLKHVLSVDDGLFGRDRAACGRLRDLAAPVLGEQALAGRFDAARGLFDAGLAGVGGRFDLMADVVRGATAAFLAELLGVEGEARARFAELAAGSGGAPDALLCPPTLAMARGLVESYDGLRELLDGLVDRGGAADGGDVVGGLLAAAGPDGAAREDVLAVLLLTVCVGAELAANLVCEGVRALWDHPDQWELLHEEPGLVAGAVEELLRFVPPVRLISRIATADTEVAGQPVERGHQVVVLVDAANRDPEVFAEPERLRVGRRQAARHLSLAEGTYAEVVAPVVRLLARAALTSLTAGAWRGLRPAGEPVHRMRSPVVRGVARFPVAVG